MKPKKSIANGLANKKTVVTNTGKVQFTVGGLVLEIVGQHAIHQISQPQYHLPLHLQIYVRISLVDSK